MIGRATSQSGTDLVLMTGTRGGSPLLTSGHLFVAELLGT